jgi:hypothetical protein
MTRQYATCTFRKGDSRSYTYHNDGDPVAIGDEVKVEDPRSTDGIWKRVYVVGVDHPKPSFPTKPILGIAPPVPAKDLLEGVEAASDAAGEAERSAL